MLPLAQEDLLSGQMQEVVEGVALQRPPLLVASLYRQVCRIAQEQNMRAPSYSVVYEIVRQLRADLAVLAHEGFKAYANNVELVHRRDAERPDAIWRLDHTLVEILVLREDGTPAAPWLTTIIDDYSRAIAGYFL